MAQKVTPRSQDYSRWYTDVVLMAELADYAPVRGCMIIRPYGYALWENIQQGLDRRFKATGHQNAYFPLFIPLSFIQKESDHVEGFSPQLAVVTHGGGEKLEEPLVVRPTSETIINSMLAQWIRSYRDLPMLLNQWCNVVRWEMRTRLFLRTTEFLWQEGHTAHATEKEAREETMRMLEVYRDFAETDAAIPVITGRKSESERFAGAVDSYSIEALMGNGWALQAATSHFLGQNFARVFGTQFLNERDEQEYAWQTSWGLSTRMVGAVVMVHGDDQGLALPPRIAPIQAVVVPIWKNQRERADVLEMVRRVQGLLGGVRLRVDDREGFTPGWKFNDWEMRGVPLRIELGPRDAAAEQVVLARRDRKGAKETCPLAGLSLKVPALLETIQKDMFDRAARFREEHTQHAEDYAGLVHAVETGFAWAWWCGSGGCEARVKDETKATVRNIPLQQPAGSGRCVVCGKEAREQAVFARAY